VYQVGINTGRTPSLSLSSYDIGISLLDIL